MEIAGYQFLQNLCIPTIMSILRDAFVLVNNEPLSWNSSLNLSDDQIESFATEVLMEELQYDLANYAKNDPAAAIVDNRSQYIWDSYKGLRAIVYYRIAHHLLDFENNCLIIEPSSAFSEEDGKVIKDYLRLQARRISEKAAIETTIEINPSAQIGKGFVIDHGVGTRIAPGKTDFSTVIGETCIIGEDCTLLNSVLLGAAVINEASSGKEGSFGKRHPTLGNGVTVCAGVRVLGNVKVGNNVTIGPCCVITTDIPDGYDVTIVNQLQFSRPQKTKGKQFGDNKPVIHGLTIDDAGSLQLFGENLEACSLSVVAFNECVELKEASLKISTKRQDSNSVIFSVQRVKTEEATCFRCCSEYSLRITSGLFEYILSNPLALNQYIRNILE